MATETPNTTPTTPTPPAVTPLERLGTSFGLISLLGIVYFLVYPHLATAVNTLSGVQSTATQETIVAIAAGALALLGTVFNLPGVVRRPKAGRAGSTVVSGAALIVAALYIPLTLLPHIANLQTLQNTTQPFAISIRDNCQTPLNTMTTDFKKTAADANANLTSPTSFATAIQPDATTLSADQTMLAAALVKLTALTVPNAKYQGLLDGCKTDVQGDIAFLSSAQAVPLATALSGADTAVDLNQNIPAALKQSVKDSLAATLPASISGLGLLQTAPLLASGSAPVTLASDVPPGYGPTVTGIVQQILAGGAAQIVGAVYAAAGAATDATLTSEGNQLKQDIKDTLTTNLAPFPVDVNAIVQ